MVSEIYEPSPAYRGNLLDLQDNIYVLNIGPK